MKSLSSDVDVQRRKAGRQVRVVQHDIGRCDIADDGTGAVFAKEPHAGGIRSVRNRIRTDGQARGRRQCDGKTAAAVALIDLIVGQRQRKRPRRDK